MLSGEFTSVPVSSISIDRPNRQRRELTGIEELAASIKARGGLIHPIVITRENVLVAGERRIAAHKHLGWDSIVVQYSDTLDPVELHALELEENIKRVDLTWQDKAKAIEEYDRLQRELDPTWNTEKSASALGLSERHVQRNVTVAKAIKANPKIAEASQFSAAHNLVQRQAERSASFEKLNLEVIGGVKTKDYIIQADFIKWAADYSGPKFNFIHCDFPYGINMHKTAQGTHHEVMADAEGETYQDTPKIFFDLCKALMEHGDNFIADSAHIMFWFHMKYYNAVTETLMACDFDVNPIPLIWHKSDNSGIISDPNRRPRHIYETAIMASRGDRKLVRPKSDLVGHPTVADTFHISNKPIGVLRYFFEQFVDSTSSVLDPTAGSGSALKAAKIFHPAHMLGLELNPEYVAQANKWVNE